MRTSSKNENTTDLIHEKECDEYIAKLIVFHLFLMCGKNMLVALVPFFYNNNNLLNWVIIGIFALIYVKLFYRFNIIKKMSGEGIAFLMVIVIFLFLSFLFNKNLFSSPNVVERMRTFIAYCIPLFIVFNTCENYDRIWFYLFRYNKLLFVVATICFATFMITKSTFQLDSSYNMSFGNNLMLVILVYIFDYWINDNIKSFCLSVICVFYLLFIGSRGPLVTICIAYLIIMILVRKKNFKQLWFRFFSAGSLFFLVINWSETVLLLMTLCEKLGIQSRTISRLGNLKAMSYNSHRDDYHNGIKEALINHPFGLGAFGGDYTVGLAHGFYWDIFANFGYYIGFLFIIFFVAAIIKKLFKYRNSKYSDCILLFSLMLLPRGFFDGTFWGSYEMWVIIALLTNVHCNKSIEKHLKMKMQLI